MRKIQDFVLKGKKIFVGLEDSKKTWKVCVRSERIVVHEASMSAEYENIRNYFRNKFPECKIRVMYEAGFRGFEWHDLLVGDGWECVVTPPHTRSGIAGEIHSGRVALWQWQEGYSGGSQEAGVAFKGDVVAGGDVSDGVDRVCGSMSAIPVSMLQ